MDGAYRIGQVIPRINRVRGSQSCGLAELLVEEDYLPSPWLLSMMMPPSSRINVTIR
jgi:hypothetical protein